MRRGDHQSSTARCRALAGQLLLSWHGRCGQTVGFEGLEFDEECDVVAVEARGDVELEGPLSNASQLGGPPEDGTPVALISAALLKAAEVSPEEFRYQ